MSKCKHAGKITPNGETKVTTSCGEEYSVLGKVDPAEKRNVIYCAFCGEQDGKPIEREAWSPLEDSGDAFRLMLDLGLRFEYFSLDPFEVSGQPVCVITWATGGERNRLCQTLTETGDEAHAVVRRAIVRAAAKIVSEEKQ